MEKLSELIKKEKMSEFKSSIKAVLISILIEALLIGLFVKWIDPTVDVSIYIMYLIPAFIIINIVLAILFSFKSKFWAIFFAVNTIVSSFILYFFFNLNIELGLKRRLDTWEFTYNDTVYYIQHRIEDEKFSISYRISYGSVGYTRGTSLKTEKEYVFITVDSIIYNIKGDYLYNFRKDSIRVKKKILNKSVHFWIQYYLSNPMIKKRNYLPLLMIMMNYLNSLIRR